MLTEDEARRIAAILKETVGQPIGERLSRIEREIADANDANIRMALQTLIGLKNLEMSDTEADLAAARKLLYALERAEALSGQQDMSVAEAEAYLRGLAQAGNQEAKKLIDDFTDPFSSSE